MGNYFRDKIFLIILLLIICFPAIFWLFLPSATKNIGQLAGLLGMSTFAVNLILSARYKFLDKNSKGLNIIYTRHHLIGGISFILLLIHPVALAINYLSLSLYSAATFLVPTTQRLDILFGEISLLVMIIVLYITFFTSFPYGFWKKTHRIIGIAFIFAVVHVLIVNSDVSRNLILRLYFIILSLTAGLSYFYRSFFPNLFVEKFPYLVTKKIKLNNLITELTLLPQDKSLIYQPGQFVFLTVKNQKLSSEEHPFSITSAPNNQFLGLIIKNLGDYTSQINLLEISDQVYLEGPYGKFSYKNVSENNFIWIAGGIGITPFISMAQNLAQEDKKVLVDLYYSVSDESELIYAKDFLAIAKANNNFRFFSHLSNKSGHLTAKLIQKTSGSLVDKHIFICGSKAMMRSLKVQLQECRVPDDYIHTEEFAL